MEERLISIGVKTGTHKDRIIKVLSNQTILDGNILLFNLNSFYNESGLIDPKIATVSKLASLKLHIDRRKKEVNEFLQNGGSIYFELPSKMKRKFRVKDEYGNWKYPIIDLAEILPSTELEFEEKSGNNFEVIPNTPHFQKFDSIAVCFEYNQIITGTKIKPLLRIRNNKHVVGGYFRYLNGHVFLFPECTITYTSQEKLIESKYHSFLKNVSLNVDKLFNSQFESIVPDWVAIDKLMYEKDTLKKIEELSNKKDEIVRELIEAKEQLKELSRLKSLFYESGDILEETVAMVMERIGFEIVQHADIRRTDLICKAENFPFVIEVKGVKKSGAEKFAAQLQKWISDYHSIHGIEPKGVLIVNTYREIALVKRSKVNFPKQMLEYSERMNICLMTGVQLLSIYLDFANKEISRNQVFDLIRKTSGVLQYEFSSHLQSINE